MNDSTIAKDAIDYIKAADKRRYLLIQEAEQQCRNESFHHQQTLKALKEKHEEAAFGLACAAGEAPYSRWGGQEDPSSVQATEDGIELQWYNNDGPDTFFLATWEALEKREEPHIEMCDCGRPWGDGHFCNATNQHYWDNNPRGSHDED
jgi:hypothetical protein